jgi:hypothetical protein
VVLGCLVGHCWAARVDSCWASSAGRVQVSPSPLLFYFLFIFLISICPFEFIFEFLLSLQVLLIYIKQGLAPRYSNTLLMY